MKNLGTIVCSDCKSEVEKTGPAMYLCRDCAKARKAARLKEWTLKNRSKCLSDARGRMAKMREAKKAKREAEIAEYRKTPEYAEELRLEAEREKKEKRRHTLWLRERKRAQSKYGKWLIEQQANVKNGYFPVFTNFRYVSQKEIDEAIEEDGGTNKYRYGAPVYRPNLGHWDYEDFRITSPGYYRVIIRKKRFLTACNDGIPWHWANGLVKQYDFYCDKKREKFWEWRRQENLREYDRKRKEELLQIRKEVIMRENERKDSRQFFQAIAMASAVSSR